MKNNRDEIIKICDELEYDKKITIYNYNQIKSTKNILENHINDNYDNYLKSSFYFFIFLVGYNNSNECI